MNFILPVKNGWLAALMSTFTSGYSFPSSHLIFSFERIVERVMKVVPLDVSMNTTGRYSGWMPSFMACLARPRERRFRPAADATSPQAGTEKDTGTRRG